MLQEDGGGWGARGVKREFTAGGIVRKEVASQSPRQGRSKGQWPGEKRSRCIRVMHIRFHIIGCLLF